MAAPPPEPRTPVAPENPPTPTAAQPTSRGGAATAIVFLLLAAVVACALIPASGQQAVGATAGPNLNANTNAHRKAVSAGGPEAVVYSYYAAINDREWSKAWALSGQPAKMYSAAYNEWVSGYGCTVRDRIIGITARGAALMVSVRAQESGGVIQIYRFSYIIESGVLTHPRTLSFTGHAPQGCGK
jgi:hypothetical protein